MVNDRDLLLSWLNGAYVVEDALATMLERHAHEATAYPPLPLKLNEHLARTRDHAAQVKRLIVELGGDPSATHTRMGNVFDVLQVVFAGPDGEDLALRTIAESSAVAFLIAAYSAIITAGQELGDSDLVQTCEDILRNERAMSSWLDMHLPSIVTTTMQQRAA